MFLPESFSGGQERLNTTGTQTRSHTDAPRRGEAVAHPLEARHAGGILDRSGPPLPHRDDYSGPPVHSIAFHFIVPVPPLSITVTYTSTHALPQGE